MIFLFTDFGAADIYLGQVHARLRRSLPGASIPIIDLMHDAPAFDVRASAHLLAALSSQFAAGDICIAVVDPGVGTARDAVAVNADDRWYVGPDNGLLSVVAARAATAQVFRIVWRPEVMSASFHGRDLFAPLGAQLASGDRRGLMPKPCLDVEFGASDLAQVIFIDHYGNAMTGLRAGTFPDTSVVTVAAQTFAYTRVFAESSADTPFWYGNSLGMIEIALSTGSAAKRCGLRVGDAVQCAQAVLAPSGQ